MCALPLCLCLFLFAPLQPALSFLATFFVAANEIDNGSSRASFAAARWVLKNGYTQIAPWLHSKQGRTLRGVGCSGAFRPSTLTASGRPNEIPFVIKPRALDEHEQRVPMGLHLRDLSALSSRVCPVICPALRPKDFSQLTKDCYNKAPVSQ